MARDKKRWTRRSDWDGTDRRDPPRVLIASDDRGTAELVSRVFDRRGFRARSAGTIEEALSIAVEDVPRAVVLDLGQKGIGSSMHLLDAIRQHADARVRNSRVILCASTRANRGFAFDSGADGFVERPYHVEDLIATVIEALQVPPDQRAEYRRDQKKLGEAGAEAASSPTLDGPGQRSG